QDGDADRGQVVPEVFQAGGDAAEGGVGGGGEGDVGAVLPGLVADPAAAQEIDVVGVVQEVFHRGWPVGGDSRGEAVEDAAVDAAGIAGGLEQEGQQRRDQHGRADPCRAVHGQVAGDFPGA